MKNLLVITSDGEQLVSSTHDTTNRLVINDTEINSNLWVGSGDYTDTVEGHAITISKVEDLDGNIILVKNSDYDYSLLKISAHSDDPGTNDNGIFYGTCTTSASTAAKIANVDNVTELKTGLTIAVKFTNSNTKANPTLNVNSLGAKSIMRYGTTAPSTSAASSWNAGSIVAFTYDGTYWIMIGWLNTTYSALSQSDMQAGTSTTARLITAARLKEAIEYYAPFTGSYNDLTDKPSIEGVTLTGNKTYEELNLQRITNSEMEDMLT